MCLCLDRSWHYADCIVLLCSWVLCSYMKSLISCQTEQQSTERNHAHHFWNHTLHSTPVASISVPFCFSRHQTHWNRCQAKLCLTSLLWYIQPSNVSCWQLWSTDTVSLVEEVWREAWEALPLLRIQPLLFLATACPLPDMIGSLLSCFHSGTGHCGAGLH